VRLEWGFVDADKLVYFANVALRRPHTSEHEELIARLNNLGYHTAGDAALHAALRRFERHQELPVVGLNEYGMPAPETQARLDEIYTTGCDGTHKQEIPRTIRGAED
jgi:hypothetical protein